MRYKYNSLFRKKGTLGIFLYDSVKDRMLAPLIQFSLVDPWFLPKIDKEYFKNLGNRKSNSHGFLAGWLFIYVGICISEREV